MSNQLPVVPSGLIAQIEAVTRRADRGDQKALAVIKQVFDEIPAVWDSYGNHLREDGATEPYRELRLSTQTPPVAQSSTDTDEPIAWRAIVEDGPARSWDGETVGTVYDVLGSNDDIFHGVVIHLSRLG